MEDMSRRQILMGLAAAGAGAALVKSAEAQCLTDPNLAAQEERLRNTLQHVQIAGDRISGAAARWIPPVDPDRPQFNKLLTDINAECQNVMDIASALLLRGA